MQHVTVTAVSGGVVETDPDPIHIYRDDQFIRFLLGPNTAWGNDPITFGSGWPGGAPLLDVNDTYVANGNDPLAPNAEPKKYSVTFNVVHTPSGSTLRHDPEVQNDPLP